MEEQRDVRAASQPSLPAAPQAATLPSMHAPHQHAAASQQQHQHQSAQPYPQTQHSQYAPPPAAQQPPSSQPPQQQYYEPSRDGHQHVSTHSQQQQPQYEYRPAAAQPPQQSSSVSLPPIQHLDASNHSASMSNTSNSSVNTQPTLPPPQQPGYPPTAYGQPWPPQHVSSPPGRLHQSIRRRQEEERLQQQAMYPPQYAQPYPYQNGMHQPPPGMVPTTMPDGSVRYGIPSNAGMDPRQMSGGRHKKEIKRRTKSGCLTCRKRRIKCDERHPHCRNCEKSKRDCLGYDPIFKATEPPEIAPREEPPQPPPEEHIKQEPQQHYGPMSYYPPPGEQYPRQIPPIHVPHGMNGHEHHGPLTDGDPNRRHEAEPVRKGW